MKAVVQAALPMLSHPLKAAPAGASVPAETATVTVAPLSATGTVCFYSMANTDVVVDINGWFASGSSYNPVGPVRLFDTRAGESPNALRSVAPVKVGGSYVLEVKVASLNEPPGLGTLTA